MTTKIGYVYIMADKDRKLNYIGMTNKLENRVLEHKASVGSAFTLKYNVNDLVYYERIEGMRATFKREKQLKNWHKDWKWNLAKEMNPELIDLAADWFTPEQIEERRLKRRRKFKKYEP